MASEEADPPEDRSGDGSERQRLANDRIAGTGLRRDIEAREGLKNSACDIGANASSCDVDARPIGGLSVVADRDQADAQWRRLIDLPENDEQDQQSSCGWLAARQELGKRGGT